jgi:hypothetical protein
VALRERVGSAEPQPNILTVSDIISTNKLFVEAAKIQKIQANAKKILNFRQQIGIITSLFYKFATENRL